MEKCIRCNVEMRKAVVKQQGLQLEALQCPKCKERVYTEELLDKAMVKLQAQRLKKEYRKKIISIGNSVGLTFPKELVEAFRIKSKTARIHPDLERRTLEISME